MGKKRTAVEQDNSVDEAVVKGRLLEFRKIVRNPHMRVEYVVEYFNDLVKIFSDRDTKRQAETIFYNERRNDYFYAKRRGWIDWIGR